MFDARKITNQCVIWISNFLRKMEKTAMRLLEFPEEKIVQL